MVDLSSDRENGPRRDSDGASLRALAQQIGAGALSSEALVEACLARIAARDEVVRAWTHLDGERALAQARARDREAPRGPLHGIPFGIKDNIDTADLPTEYGSPIYRGHRPAADAAVVAQLRAAGAVILGKTATAEFATFTPTTTTHPLDPNRSPGGSSSGSAAAVADAMAPAALGTQTMGSVIRPASYCGIVGMKPSFGAISRIGIKVLAETLDTIGFFCADIDDAALLLSVLARYDDDTAAAEAPARLRVGVFANPYQDQIEPAMVDAVAAAGERLAAAGAEVSAVGEQSLCVAAVDAHWAITHFEMGASLADEWQRHGELLSPRLAEIVTTGMAWPRADYLAALATAARARDWAARVFADVDVLIDVAAPGEAPVGLESTGDPLFNRLWTLLGLPVLTLPAATGPSGMPLGIQLVGRFNGDAVLIATARRIADILA